MGASLQSQDLQRQFSRRQDEIDAENKAVADRLERAVQAATIDAAEKKCLQVPKTPSVKFCCMTGVAVLPGLCLASPAACFPGASLIQLASVCPPCRPHTPWNLQDQLITSEEQRLEVSQVLLDFQLEHNHAKVGRAAVR